MSHYVITLSRQFASMGRSIAQEMSRQLGIEFYDRDIVEAAAARMGLPVSIVSDQEDSMTNRYFKRIYPLGTGMLSVQDELFMTQKNIIRDLAAKESCIIVGRCADAILADFDNVLNVRVFAPYEARLANCINRLGMDEKTARKMIDRVDKSRDNFHREYTGCDVLEHCHLQVNSSLLGIEGSAELLCDIVKKRFAILS